MAAWTYDKSEWTECYCGSPASVINHCNLPHLLCIFHDKNEGAIFPLPKVKPDDWPPQNKERLDEIMKQGQEEDIASN